jgi:hypothetical protein
MLLSLIQPGRMRTEELSRWGLSKLKSMRYHKDAAASCAAVRLELTGIGSEAERRHQ